MKNSAKVMQNLLKELNVVKSILNESDLDDPNKKFTNDKVCKMVTNKLIKIKRLAQSLTPSLFKDLPEAKEILNVLKSIDPNFLEKGR